MITAIIAYCVPGTKMPVMYGHYEDAEEALAWCRANPQYKPVLYLHHKTSEPLPVSDVEF